VNLHAGRPILSFWEFVSFSEMRACTTAILVIPIAASNASPSLSSLTLVAGVVRDARAETLEHEQAQDLRDPTR